MDILVLNAGSSSLKFQLFNMKEQKVIVKGICERVGTNNGADAFMEYKVPEKNLKKKIQHVMPDHKEAIELMLNTMIDSEIGVIKNTEDIDAIGHRVLHGEEYYKESVIIDDEVMKKLEEFAPLGPLHMPPNIMGIKICMELIPGKTNVAVFDTAFHQTMPDYAYTYPLPYADYEELKVRKYGFHGTSHRYVTNEMLNILGKTQGTKIITCHLGNGSSITAVKDGKVVDTSMGLTPLEGLMMGTRCGNIDPAAVLYVMEKRGFSAKEMDNYMNKKSGILGIYEKNSDFREVRDDYLQGEKRATLAFKMLTYRVKQYIGNYAAVLGGVDAIVFTGGIGENSAITREEICSNLGFMGIEIDKKVNDDLEKNRNDGNILISKTNAPVKVYRIQTDEELMIAQDTYELV